MAVAARWKNGSRAAAAEQHAGPDRLTRHAEQRGGPDRLSRHGPLRDWRRAFALVDELKSEYGAAPWFAGVRALRDAATGAIAIHVEAVRPAPAGVVERRVTWLPPTLSSRFTALGVRVRLLNGLAELGGSSFGAADAAAAG